MICRDFCADARLRQALLDGDAAVGFLDRLDHRLDVHRPDGAQIDDLGIESLAGHRFGGLNGVGHADAEGHDGDIEPSL